MAKGGPVHWAEGLFLRPQHFQHLQRSFTDQLSDERSLTWSYPYGVVDAHLMPADLANKIVRFDRLRVVMPCGVVVDVPGNADLEPMSVKEAVDSSNDPVTVYLSIPLWRADKGNTLESDEPAAGGRAGGSRIQERRLYKLTELERRDENSGDNPQPIVVRRLNAKLLLSTDDRSDLDVIPILRIVRSTGRELGLPTPDRSFAPPCLVLGGSKDLRDIMTALASRVEATRTELVVAISRGGFSIESMRGPQIEQLMRLQILNRYAGRLRAIAAAPGTTPFNAYLEMRTLLSELSSLKPDQDIFDAAQYDHDNPLVSFSDVYLKAVSLLTPEILTTSWNVKFQRDGRILSAALEEKHFTAPNEYFLAVKSSADPKEMADLLENRVRFKLMSRDRINQALPGVKITEERAPQGLPTPPDVRYFRLNPNDDTDSTEMWESITRDRGMALRWPNMERSDFEITLYMLIPPGRRES